MWSEWNCDADERRSSSSWIASALSFQCGIAIVESTEKVLGILYHARPRLI